LRRMVALVGLILLIQVLSLITSLGAASGAFPQAISRRVQILGVLAADSTPYNQPLTVTVLVAHDAYQLPQVVIFYMPIFENRTISSFWRIAPAQPVQSYSGMNETLYAASVPNVAFGDQLATGTIIVYYVQAVDASGSALTTRESDRWNPNITDDKFALLLIDQTPPSISYSTITPNQPVSGHEVIVLETVTDGKLGSGVASVTLYYSVDNGPFTAVPMTLVQGDIYSATIPRFEHDHTIAYYVTAFDKAGNKNITPRQSYLIQKSPEELVIEQQTDQRNALLIGSITSIAIIGVVLWKRRTITALTKRETAFTIAVIIVFLVAARVAYVLWAFHGLWWWNAIILIALIESWALVDPRIKGTMRPMIKATLSFGGSLTAYLSRTFQENPPTILVGAAYVLGFAGAISDLILYVATRNLYYAYVLANFIAEYVFILLALGVIGQLIMLSRKKT
jgi:hypothetical protein